MKIIKRNGTEVPFDITKIIVAVSKANQSVDEQLRLSREQITQIAAAVRSRRRSPTAASISTARSAWRKSRIWSRTS